MLPIGDENEPGRGLALLTLAVIGINVFVFLVLQGAGGDETFTYAFSAVPYEIVNGIDLVEDQVIRVGGQAFAVPQEPGPDPVHLTLLSSMFMHGGWLHLGGNMLFLFIFGDNVEHFVGTGLYLLFYLAAGLVATVAHILVEPGSVIPTLGASGAISGVLGAYLVLFPTNRVTVLIFRFPAEVPALVAIGLWAAFQFINGLGAFAVTAETSGGVAYMAHIGGFVAGLLGGFLFRGMLGAPVRRPRRAAWY